ncbi:thioredoxin peroxidase [Roseivivax halodurans JCM 10272]|uniref:Thioredoxin peroxidase n=1 Tax=Roseivivax halodurans JCM 10272 TaxID=1449350 RepID=X7EJR6_9RHOB|nr:redoxin domain-containing protein [Roseivivax halodurans]ETX16140.1 thioredoxin peroxidase [Roseivivax halodurans JCM 10272]
MASIAPDQPFPELTLPRLGGGELALGTPSEGYDWQFVVVYRGLHCPICKDYLRQIETLKSRYHELGVEIVAVSADPEEKAQAFVDETGISIPVAYDLSIEDMHRLGLFVSDPRSPEETDRPFAEPGHFVINEHGKLQIVEIANAPFVRPDLQRLADGIEFVREKGYPVRGTRMAA